jgi:hypothetical protein
VPRKMCCGLTVAYASLCVGEPHFRQFTMSNSLADSFFLLPMSRHATPAQAVVSTGSAMVKFTNLPTPIRSVLRTSATPKWASSDGPFIKSGD